MGSVVKVGKFWIVRERIDGRQKDFRPGVHGFPNSEKGAKSFLAALRTRLDSGTYVAPSKDTVGGYADRWLSSKKIGARTRDLYEYFLRVYIKPGLGDVALAKLTPVHIREFYDNLSEYSPRKKGEEPSFRVQEGVHITLKAILTDAVEMEVIPKSPMKQALRPVRPKKQKRPTCYTPEQSQEILRLVVGTRLHIPVTLALYTGMRVGEICALKWEDVDLDRKRILIRRSMSAPRSGLHEKETKTGIERSIPVSDVLVRLLVRWKGEQAETRLKMGDRWKDHGYVFPNRDGTPEHPLQVANNWRRFPNRADLPYYPFHSFRHTHVSLLIAEGVPMKAISERVGHSKIDTTMDIYGHLFEQGEREAVEKLDRALGV